ncbi:MAG: ABC transporter permease subunit, partial [Alphaproteobacteria bacterium]
MRSSSSLRRDSRLLAPLAWASAAASALVLALVLGFLGHEAWPVLRNGGWIALLTGSDWYPLDGDIGLLAMLWATLAAGTGAILLAGPLGLACAVFLRFYAPSVLARPFQAMLGLMAGVPSVVYGLWGLTVLVPSIGAWQAPGASLLAGILILALMILPTVAMTAAAALAHVPPPLLEGAGALGLSRMTTILAIAVPAARGGIVGGVLLALARALGETMAILMVAGNVVRMPS